jgi:hypothetical protein
MVMADSTAQPTVTLIGGGSTVQTSEYYLIPTTSTPLSIDVVVIDTGNTYRFWSQKLF